MNLSSLDYDNAGSLDDILALAAQISSTNPIVLTMFHTRKNE